MQILQYQITVRYITSALPPSEQIKVQHTEESHYSTNPISHKKGRFFNSVVVRSPTTVSVYKSHNAWTPICNKNYLWSVGSRVRVLLPFYCIYSVMRSGGWGPAQQPATHTIHYCSGIVVHVLALPSQPLRSAHWTESPTQTHTVSHIYSYTETQMHQVLWTSFTEKPKPTIQISV